MAEKSSGTKEKQEEAAEPGFKCQRCGKLWSVNNMRRISRFHPPVVVCPDCEKAFL